ncbi:unnamed protein product [Oncorhynchus mykiss]|uniref:EGF-like domain-containing protein n=1 Tax=Oncorhynchus mykiss TaxID=8022 RepID=A0A060X3I4_ONCMY|nr:unnamed protein product [Oncorhynchus mykiss]
MTLFEEYIYWTDWETKSINRCHKTQGTNKTMLISTLHRPMDVHIYHPYRQPEGMMANHPCQTNNGGCSNLCLLSPGGGYNCACPTNFYLASDGRQCMSNCTASQVSLTNLSLSCFMMAKGFQHQRMTNGAMNVEIGNPAYKIYEGEPDEDAGDLLDSDFTLDPDKVNKVIQASTQTLAPCHTYLHKQTDTNEATYKHRPTTMYLVDLMVLPGLFPAHQLHQPSVRHPVHGSPQQPQLPGQHR